MNRWRQMLERMEPAGKSGGVPVKVPQQSETRVLDAGTLLLCEARKAGCPRLRLQPGVYVCQGVEAWRRFVRTAEPEWLEKAELALTMLTSADKPEGSHDGN